MNVDTVRKNLETSLASKDVEEIKLNLKYYADYVQHVKLQIAALELIAKLSNGVSFELLEKEVRQLAYEIEPFFTRKLHF